MTPAATGVDCYAGGPRGQVLRLLAGHAARRTSAADNLWYRFVVTDGTDTDYYADDTPALDGGLGAATDDQVDNSWALMLYEPGFTAPSWAKDAVIYQIFPDRFRNGRKDNDPKTGDVRYDDPVIKLALGREPRGLLPQLRGRRRRPARGASTTRRPPTARPRSSRAAATTSAATSRASTSSSTTSRPSASTTVYFNPIFDAGSNHAYDTQDYKKIDPYFGTQKDCENLVKHAKRPRDPDRPRRRVQPPVAPTARSSTATTTTRRSAPASRSTSPFRGWFVFHDVAAGHRHLRRRQRRRKSATYDGWFGFDSIPVIDKAASNTERLELLPDRLRRDRQALARAGRRRLAHGRLGRRVVPGRLLGDLPRGRQGDPARRADHQRDVAEGLDAAADDPRRPPRHDDELPAPGRRPRLPGAGSLRLQGLRRQRQRIIAPSEFLDRLSSIREDYPDAAYYSLMNLLDSHDTERLLWTLTPGAGDDGRQGARTPPTSPPARRASALASLIQFTRPGRAHRLLRRRGRDDRRRRPRRPPHVPVGGPRRHAGHASCSPTTRRSPSVRRDIAVLTGRRLQGAPRRRRARASPPTAARPTSQAAARRRQPRRRPRRPWTIPSPATSATASRSPRGYARRLRRLGRRRPRRRASVERDRPGQRRACCSSRGNVGPRGPRRPRCCTLGSEGNGDAGRLLDRRRRAPSRTTSGRSPVSGGGCVKANAVPGHRHRRSPSPASTTASPTYVVVTATDAAGNAGALSNEVDGPAAPTPSAGRTSSGRPTMTHTISAVNRTDTAYGQVWIDGVTSQPGATPGAARPAGLRPRRLRSRRQRRLDLGRRGVQHRRRQQRRVQGQPPAGDGRLVRLRVAVLHHRRPRLGLRGPRRHRQRRTRRRRPGRSPSNSSRRHHRARDARRTCASWRPRRPASSSPGTRSPVTPSIWGYEVQRAGSGRRAVRRPRPR